MMRRWILTILTITLISSQVFAQSTILDKDDPAPYRGILLTPERAEEAAKAEKKVIVLSDLRIAQEELTEYHKDQAKVARRKLTEAKYDSYKNVLISFFVGVIATSVAMKINQEINK